MQKINEWWRTKFKNITLTRKMLLVYAVFAGFFFGVSILAFQGSTDVFEKKLYDNSIRELDYYAKDVKDSLQRVSDRSYEMLLDSELQSILGKLQQTKPETLEYNQLLTSIRWSLVNDKNLKSDIQTIYYIDNYGNTVESGQAAWEIPEEEKDVFMQKIRDSNGEAVFYGPTKKCKYLLCGRKMLNWQDMSLENMGTLMLVCDVGQMIERDKKLLEAEHASMFVYTDDHMIYQDIEESLPPLPQNKDGQGYKVLNYQGERYFMCYLSTSENGWMYVNFFPYSDVYGQIERVRNLALCSFCVVFVLLLFLIHRISEIITRPLETLVRSMQVVETGDFESAKQIPMDAEREDEVGLLTKEFRVMLDQIDVLVKENYEKQFLLKDTKYKMLQAQINPHFLYNTLNVIHWMIRAKENEKASRMIVELGALLRASFDENPYIAVEEEIGMLENYLKIQRYRYEDRADFTVEKNGNLGKYVMPRMTLQPLVENAIFYGADQMEAVCHIKITITEEENNILFEVKDNGPGMTEEELEGVRKFTVKPKGHGIGIKNIYERLNITYETFQFQIESKVGKGTMIRIRVPKLRTEGKQNV